jgi:putative sterol carrier protein
MLVGKLDPMAAFSLGKLQLEGDLGVAMKLGSLMKR